MFEKVNPQNPDKVADRIAGAIVDLAYKNSAGGFAKGNPRIAVEVLLGHGKCTVIVETSLGRRELQPRDVEKVVERIAGRDIVSDILFVAQDAHLADNQSDGLRCGDNGVFRGVPMTKEQFLLKHIAKSTYANYPSDGKYVISKVGTNSAGGDCFDVVICQSKLPQAQETEFKEKVLDTLYRSYVSNLSDNPKAEFTTNINPLGEWEGGTDVDCGATNRKLGSDMGDAVTGGGLHGKDLSKADVSVNIVCHIKAQAAKQRVEAYCAIGDGEVVFNYEDGNTEIMLFPDVVELARQWLQAECGGSFERLAEWGLIR